MNTENQNQEKGNDNKVAKVYEKNMLKVVAILGGKDVKLPTKVEKNSISNIVAELFKEEMEATNKKVKEDLKDLLKKHVEAGKAINAKKQELAQLEIQKKKEFNDASNKLFNQVEGVDSLLQDYQASLGEAASSIEEE